jgi:hypothetical protein
MLVDIQIVNCRQIFSFETAVDDNVLNIVAGLCVCVCDACSLLSGKDRKHECLKTKSSGRYVDVMTMK